MLVPQGREASDIFRFGFKPFPPQLIQGRLHIIHRVPKHQYVDDQAEGTELIFLTFPVAFPDLTALAMKHFTRQAVTSFAPVKLSQDASTVSFVIHEAQKMDGFRYPAQISNGKGQRRWPLAAQQRAYQF